jgi:neutral ceramidase
MRTIWLQFPLLAILLTPFHGSLLGQEYPWRVGAATREMTADDSMVIGGGIGPGYAQGQEGKLQATALAIHGDTKLCIIAVDILMMHRDYLDRAARSIESQCGIPFDHILINASHTHHAPSTVTVHGYERDEEFCERTVQAIVEAAVAADKEAERSPPTRARFRLGQEATVGQNSRQLLKDGKIYWIGPRDDFVRPTGPFDVDLPVMAFESEDGKLQAAWFNHSTHCIGTRTGKRSPSFYGLAAQELSEQHNAPFLFLSGAAGSTHNLLLNCDEMVIRMKAATNESLASGAPMRDSKLRAIKREFPFDVRTFDEMKEDSVVVEYCRKYAPGQADGIIEVFRESRRKLKPQQGEQRRMWLQAMRIGEVYLVAVPAEFFTALGLEIKSRSPYRHTFVCGLSNDYVGYTPTREGFELGGYQTWTGLHSFSEVGTGEKMVEECLALLGELTP